MLFRFQISSVLNILNRQQKLLKQGHKTSWINTKH